MLRECYKNVHLLISLFFHLSPISDTDDFDEKKTNKEVREKNNSCSKNEMKSVKKENGPKEQK